MNYQQQFIAIDKLLLQSQRLWQVVAFKELTLPWAQVFTHLAVTVDAIDDADIDNIDADSELLYQTLLPSLQQDLEQLGEVWDLSLLMPSFKQLPEVERVLDKQIDSHFSAHIKGRKWQQINQFVAGIGEVNEPVLEWCAGKGHLGRLIAKSQQVEVTSIEWQSALCEAGDAFAQRWQLAQQFVCADVFNDDVSMHFKPQQHCVALHACGELHQQLLAQASSCQCEQITISPCCYHLIQTPFYQAMSTLAQQSQLVLAKHDLQLPLQQSVIANDKAKALRLQEVSWRLGFDCLQRDCSGRNHYLPIPAIKQSQLSGSFSEFCHWAAAAKQVGLPEHIDFDEYLIRGQQRQAITRRIDLVAHLFRQLLEHWLLLDRVCFLQESGYQVSLTQFCDATVTPRNAFISAKRVS
ncbi:methyltransferase [Shewanella marina]|uniref:methyltransferase n=1 Tax=Shewanella marina TaxID=487319 RepID=UPI000472BAAC|nr:methyltransferase [Shewanella marina]